MLAIMGLGSRFTPTKTPLWRKRAVLAAFAPHLAENPRKRGLEDPICAACTVGPRTRSSPAPLWAWRRPTAGFRERGGEVHRGWAGWRRRVFDRCEPDQGRRCHEEAVARRSTDCLAEH